MNAIKEKPKFPLDEAQAVAEQVVKYLSDTCGSIIIAGSIRRQKPMVGDVEILYIPKYDERPVPGDMFAWQRVNLADERIDALIDDGILAKRLNAIGSEMYGTKNKLCRHVESGIPVDLFSATPETWWNQLVCRTGPADLNRRICELAQAKRAMWHPYSNGFTTRHGDEIVVRSEEDVFRYIGLPYLDPQDRK